MARRHSPPRLPDPIDRSHRPYVLPVQGWWLVIGDVHLPFHDRVTIELAIEMARRRRAVGVLLNGDLLDCHELSRFDKSPLDPRYVDEVQMGRQFLAYVRHRMPKAVIVWKDGNHEERAQSYLFSRAPALFGLDVLTIPHLLDFAGFGVEYVTDRRVIHAGKLNIIHGHEYRPTIQTPVNAARGLFLRAKSVAMTNHFHQVSEHHEPNINGKPQGAWSVGCACHLSPFYMPLNRWSSGFALVNIYGQDEFSVENKRVISGQVV